MTQNQINYWSLQENKRHNVASEQELNRHNVTTESETYRHDYATEQETNRHNLRTEDIDLSKLAETTRHNQVTEAETNRHNIVTEDMTQQTINETARHNRASESLQSQSIAVQAAQVAETTRHNQTQEAMTFTTSLADINLKNAQASAALENAAANSANASTKQQSQDFIEYQYNDTGRAKSKSETTLNGARTGESITKSVDNATHATKNILDGFNVFN